MLDKIIRVFMWIIMAFVKISIIMMVGVLSLVLGVFLDRRV